MERNNFNIKLGQRIMEARKSANLTQVQLHGLTKISITQLSNYENGRRNIGLENLALIAKATNLTIDELYFGSPAKKPISISENDGELVVNCINALHEKGVVDIITVQDPNDPWNIQYVEKLSFLKYYNEIYDLVDKLNDFEKNKENYREPEKFKRQFMDAIAAQINKKTKK